MLAARIFLRGAVALAVLVAAQPAQAEAPEAMLERYAAMAKQQDPGFQGFSAERGLAFYRERHVVRGVGAIGCASCHRKNPREQIRAHRVDIPCRACHVINDNEHPDPEEAKKRIIEPFAPAANAERFTDFEVVERFFKLNCTMLLKRECTTLEKGDLIAWLLTVQGPAILSPLMGGAAVEEEARAPSAR